MQVVGKTDSPVKIVHCCPKLQDGGVPLYLIDIVVEGWGVDRPSVEEQDPKMR
jgi:hypothetical protein